MSYYKKHLFMCINQREGEKKCCNNAGATQLCDYAKARIREKRLDGKGGIRINKAGCLGRCKEGPVMVVYPDNVWYTYQNEADIDTILEATLENNTIVEHLKLSDN